jgi:hypothetical protein
MPEGPHKSELQVSRSSMRRRNHAIWLGPLIVFTGAVSYFTFFAEFPVLRDFPWINLPIVLVGCGISFVAMRRAFSRAHIYRGKVLGSLSMIFSSLLTALFVGYIGYLSYQLPEPTKTTQSLSLAPGFVLNDQNGQEVSLEDFQGKKLIVTFYRGHW